jgi:hypothetical protein
MCVYVTAYYLSFFALSLALTICVSVYLSAYLCMADGRLACREVVEASADEDSDHEDGDEEDGLTSVAGSASASLAQPISLPSPRAAGGPIGSAATATATGTAQEGSPLPPPRTCLPANAPETDLNLMALMRRYIGKDLSKVRPIAKVSE